MHGRRQQLVPYFKRAPSCITADQPDDLRPEPLNSTAAKCGSTDARCKHDLLTGLIHDSSGGPEVWTLPYSDGEDTGAAPRMELSPMRTLHYVVETPNVWGSAG